MYENDNPIHQLVHDYVDGAIDRRELFRRVVRHTGSAAAATVALSGFSEALAQSPGACPDGIRTSVDDPAIRVEDVSFPNSDGIAIYGHLAYPRNIEIAPAVIVVHENRGLVDHIKDVTRRVAKAGFVGLGVDLLSRQGGTHTIDPQQLNAAYNRTNQFERRIDLTAGLDFLKRLPYVEFDRIGMVGFCAGGANTWDFAVNMPELAAAVPFYGTPPSAEDLERLRTPVLAIYAERDRNLTRLMLAAADNLVRLQKTFGLLVYEGVGHAFHSDVGNAYNPEAACDAWAKTIGYFNKWLRRPR